MVTGIDDIHSPIINDEIIREVMREVLRNALNGVKQLKTAVTACLGRQQHLGISSNMTGTINQISLRTCITL